MRKICDVNLTLIIKKSERFVTSFIMVAILLCWTDFTNNLFYPSNFKFNILELEFQKT